MCYERHLRRRREEAQEVSGLWQDFERTRPIADPAPPTPEKEEPERAEEPEESPTR
jgi:hypothetical protein